MSAHADRCAVCGFDPAAEIRRAQAAAAKLSPEGRRGLDLERSVALDLVAILKKLRPDIDLVGVGVSVSTEGDRLENARAWGDKS